MKTLNQSTSRELEIEQVRRRIEEADSELLRITTQVLPGMMEKQSRRRKELQRQVSALQNGEFLDSHKLGSDCGHTPAPQ